MALIDEHTQVAIEIVSEGTKLTGELIAGVLRTAKDMLSDTGKSNRNSNLYDNKTPSGKQKINDLIKKHVGGIDSLDENISKEQVKDYSKELKKLGVDFSVVKNGKDDYSFFFASKDSAVLEKALKNVISKKNKKLSKNSNREEEKESKDTHSKKANESNLSSESNEEKILSKLNSKNDEIIINTNSKKSIVEGIRSSLTDKEFALFLQKNKKEIQFSEGQGMVSESRKFKEMLGDYEPKEISKVNTIYEKYIHVGNDKAPKNHVHSNEVDVLLTELKTEKNITLDSVLSKMNDKEQKLFFQLAEKRKESILNNTDKKERSVESNNYETMKNTMSNDSVKKVEKIFDDTIFSGSGKTPAGQLNINNVQNKDKVVTAEKGLDKEKSNVKTENNASKDNFYSMKNVRKIDKEIKAKEKEQQTKIKNKKQEQIR
ncbi:DUF3801 domain-containing protein [Enterococcus sp. DIV0206e]|uniref:DUF3801 domain-containing protein n=1 Tax=Enterococcus sp. DIV0206e TaxID=2774690 RepID=UPI003F22EB8C